MSAKRISINLKITQSKRKKDSINQKLESKIQASLKMKKDFFRAILSQEVLTNRLYGILAGILCAVCLSAFIYLEHFLGNKNLPLYSTLFAIFGFFLYLKLSRLGAFICGGMLGILWFYWVGFSFRFYDLSYFIPLVWIVFFAVYGALFYLFCFFSNPFYRLILLTLSSFIHPFGFNWLIMESVLTKSYFFPSKFTLFLLLCAIIILSALLAKKLYKTSLIWLCAFTLLLPHNAEIKKDSNIISLKIKTTRFEIPQDERWQISQMPSILTQNFDAILDAKNAGYDLVVLPETAFPLSLNLEPTLIEKLKEYSKGIAILTGAIFQDSTQEKPRFFNSAYLFENGEMQVFHKQILVPFGEKIPLPDFLAKRINKMFFDGAEDFITQDFKTPNFAWIKNQRFQIAICYEATRDEFYTNSPSNLIAISNNAWFAPSIEPTLQKLLMLYFSKNHNTTIYHSSNASKDFTLP
ncbi:apolipoprotein N-acyltransferase [Helicobacter sp.]|uniref:apolipoprotein N-acyltransferase n=1 Tax=Helicobacter sp. TaxID=218 RepID=UPI0025C0C83D|nr:apolipoprotein N-acyltransferase [Helicobacter sp.]MCI5968402.1 apolipoprotein N-acyltransferase [Helicobacter sp.]MDY2585187.1 apolipoprotein N-acyltransferase [Helicobacter sp.]